jgi:hypothetical protein
LLKLGGLAVGAVSEIVKYNAANKKLNAHIQRSMDGIEPTGTNGKERAHNERRKHQRRSNTHRF